MAEFSDLGARCTLEECKQHDFLPFTCERCFKAFCLNHRTPDSHNCSVAVYEGNVIICPKCSHAMKASMQTDTQSLLVAHLRTSCKQARDTPLCPVLGCGKKLTETGSIVCPSCRKRVCLSHRYTDCHLCVSTQSPVSPGRSHGVPLDWVCLECKSGNTGTSYRCLKCNIPRKPTSPPTSPTRRKTTHHKCIIS
jgi:hypothetical protein